MSVKSIFTKSRPGCRAYSRPRDVAAWEQYRPPQELLRQTSLPLPEVNELDIMRHYSQLARRNLGIDTHFYPLGSCTMKYNPRIAEVAAGLPDFRHTHPLAPDAMVQGNLRIAGELVTFLCDVTGMAGGTLVPNAGAQGELVGIQMIAAYHQAQGEGEQRREILVPDSAHGTNPATAAMAGYRVVTLRSQADGDLDLEHLRACLGPQTAGLMLTNPNTLGIFSPQILEISRLVHAAGGLLYYDGANLNAILEMVRPGDMGFDVMHLNLHKTFATPHGGGGPGSGPVLCNKLLQPFLPLPRVVQDPQGQWRTVWHDPASIGQIATFHGNFAIWLRAYLYARLHGHSGLRRVAQNAVLNANYLKKALSEIFKAPYEQFCMHEFVLQADRFVAQGVRALDIAKRLLDYGFHAPTIYFPLIVKECLLIEPTETESKDTLDAFIAAFEAIAREAESNPDYVKNAPYDQSVKRLDEARAARSPILKNI